MKLFKWFWTKKKIFDYISQLEKDLENSMKYHIEDIEKLDQNKVYYICSEDSSQKDLDSFYSYLNRIKKKMKWTMPTILLINKKLNELDKEELKQEVEKHERKN